MPKQDRHFCFTINNWTEEELNQLKEIELKKIKYIIVGEEIAPTTGTPHLQCFITWASVKTESACKKRLPKRAYVRFMYDYSTPTACAEYCKKQKVIYEEGCFPRQGQRNDLVNVVKEVKLGKSVKQMTDDNVIKNYQGLKYAQELKKIYEPKRDWKPDVIWWWGEAGTGKSWRARQLLIEQGGADNFYPQRNTNQWWEGYDGEEYILIDDIRGSFSTFNDFIKLIDRYEYRVQTKGSSRQFLAKVIIITSPFPPERVWQTHECINQLLDRIDVIKHWEGKNYRAEEKIERKKKLESIYG